MTNHVHLVLEPVEDHQALGQLMKRLAGRQTRYINHQEGRRGTLWESRYKSSPIQTDSYFMAYCRYVELNPVRAGMVNRPEEYQWSSYSTRMGLSDMGGVDDHECYQALGKNMHERNMRYKEFVRSAIPDGEWALIRQSVQRGQLTGNNIFIDEVERMTGRRIEHRSPGNQRRNKLIK